MRFFVLTDIEGVAGVDSFAVTRSHDEERKASAMAQLAREVNACVDGIRSVHPDAKIDVWDGHGTGGLRETDVEDATYLDEGRPYYDLAEHDAVLFVGQHAMAGMPDAPLSHTYSSRSIAYYKLNGTFVGEFACRALVAGRQDVPTVFLAGDDKAALEAELFVPDIETAVTKWGTGRESAEHRDPDEACEAIREGARRAVDRLDEIPPYTGLTPPYVLDVGYYDRSSVSKRARIPRWIRSLPGVGRLVRTPETVSRVDERTVRIEADDVVDPPPELYRRL